MCTNGRKPLRLWRDWTNSKCKKYWRRRERCLLSLCQYRKIGYKYVPQRYFIIPWGKNADYLYIICGIIINPAQKILSTKNSLLIIYFFTCRDQEEEV